ncbi:MAG: adenylyl cyclase, partial [Gemmatimonadota bacterium]
MADPPGYQRFFAELKRRRVFRVMAVYGVVAFVLLQVVDLLVPALLLPEWTYRLVAILLLLGFPVAVVLAWAFELTPAGVRRTRSATPEEISEIASAPAGRRWPVGLAALAGAALLGLGAGWALSSSADAPGDGAYSSIAVLPFANLTGDEEAEYLGDGLAEELLNALSGIEGLRVPSRTSSFAFKGSPADARTIGDSLDVGLVLEGSVRGHGERLRITAQLIDAEDGYHVWSRQYDRNPADLLDLQEDIAARIVDALALELDTGEADALLDRGTRNAEAYDLYLQGRHFWNKRNSEDLAVARRLFERAIEIDSSYAPAYAAIADAWVVPAAWEGAGDESTNDAERVEYALDEGIRYARLALDLDPTLAQAHTALA